MLCIVCVCTMCVSMLADQRQGKKTKEDSRGKTKG
jgi:hypothetical protein